MHLNSSVDDVTNNAYSYTSGEFYNGLCIFYTLCTL